MDYGVLCFIAEAANKAFTLMTVLFHFNLWGPGENGWHFADNILNAFEDEITQMIDEIANFIHKCLWVAIGRSKKFSQKF